MVILGDVSSVRVIAPEDLPLGQDLEVETVILIILPLCRPRLMRVFVSLTKKFKKKKIKTGKKLLEEVYKENIGWVR